MRRLPLLCIFTLLAASAGAATPYSLDRDGTLWKAVAGPEGLVLTSERAGAVLLSSTVPFPADPVGGNDHEIQVTVDELTGKVAVVWQRSFPNQLSDIMMAVFHAGGWESIVTLSPEAVANPRFPTTQLTHVKTTVTDPEDETLTSVIEDSFLHIVWWQGSGSAQHGTYALVRLSASPEDDEAPALYNVDDFLQIGMACAMPAPSSVLEHPLFADESLSDRALLLHGSRRACLFQLVEISFKLQEPQQTQPGITVVAQRRRHTPVFGVRALYSVPRQMDMNDARMVLGENLKPVAYRVKDGQIEFVSATSSGWTPRCTLPTSEGLTLDKAIPLVERLAR